MLPIWIDTDPGVDDAMALVYAVRSQRFDIRGISIVAGNVPVELGAENARRILGALGRADIPVAIGAPAPLLRPFEHALGVHGEQGLGGVEWPAPVGPVAEQAGALSLIQACLSTPTPLTVVTLGPLTNMALALAVEPRIKPKIARIFSMGGALFCPGNTRPAVEYNFFADPEAARMVLRAGVPITLVGLDVTMEAMIDADHWARFERHSDPVVQRVGAMGQHLLRLQREWYGRESTPVHDALALAAAADPDVLTTEALWVDIETQSDLAPGHAVADRWGRAGRAPNVDAALDVDAARFIDLFTTVIETSP